MGTMPRLVERGKKDRRIGVPGGLDWDAIQELELDPRVELDTHRFRLAFRFELERRTAPSLMTLRIPVSASSRSTRLDPSSQFAFSPVVQTLQ